MDGPVKAEDVKLDKHERTLSMAIYTAIRRQILEFAASLQHNGFRPQPIFVKTFDNTAVDMIAKDLAAGIMVDCQTDDFAAHVKKELGADITIDNARVGRAMDGGIAVVLIIGNNVNYLRCGISMDALKDYYRAEMPLAHRHGAISQISSVLSGDYKVVLTDTKNKSSEDIQRDVIDKLRKEGRPQP